MTVARRASAAGALLLLAACGGGHGEVNCPTDCPAIYTLGGSFSGVVGTRLTLEDTLASGPFNLAPFGTNGTNGTQTVFFAASANESYNVVVATQPTNPSQTCVVANGAGTVGSSDVTNIVVTCTTNPPRFVYVTNAGSSSISAYSVDAADGSLTPIAGSPFPAGGQPSALTVDPTGHFAFIANHADATISAFSIDRGSGALTPVSGSPFATGAGPTSVATDPSSSFLYVTSGGANAMFAYTIDANTGALTAMAGSPFAVGAEPAAVAVDPTQSLVYVANQGDDTLSTFSYVSGPLTAVTGSPVAASSGPCAISAAPPKGQFLFVANCAANSVSSFNDYIPAPGDLTKLSTITIAGGADPVSIATDPDAYFVYVANRGSNSIAGYSIGGMGFAPGALTPLEGSPYAAGSAPSAVAVDPTGRFAFVVNSGSGSIAVYAIDPTSGALSAIGGPYATGDGPSAVAISD